MFIGGAVGKFPHIVPEHATTWLCVAGGGATIDMMLVGSTGVVWVFCGAPVFMNVDIDELLSALVLVIVFVMATFTGRLDKGNGN